MSITEAAEAMDWLRDNTDIYEVYIPGSADEIDSFLDDVDTIRYMYAAEVDSILLEAYQELEAEAILEDMTPTKAEKAWAVLQKHMQRVDDLALDAGDDVLANHYALKAKVGRSLDQLKQMGDSYGADAKKQVDATNAQIKDLLAKEVDTTSAKIQNLVDAQKKKVQAVGDKAWDQSMAMAKPVLEKNAAAKKVVEENQVKLRGNVAEFNEKVNESVQAGNAKIIEDYASMVGKVQQRRSDRRAWALAQYLRLTDSGADVISNLKKIQQIAQQYGSQGEQLGKDTLAEVDAVLKKRVGQGQDLAKDAKSESSNATGWFKSKA
ncbi:hypothetical protein MMC21_005285 [Puttea exsequens]|nr:hypothetical protein [Puttea exsequens]